MDKPTIIGITDGPMHSDAELVRKVDFVIFGDWPSTFEPHRVGEVTPKNWRHSPLVVAKKSVGSRRLIGVHVFWGPDSKELSELILSGIAGNTSVVVITGSGDGSATKAAKKIGALVEVIASGRLVMVSCMNGNAQISYKSGVEAKVAPKAKAKPKVKIKTPVKEIKVVKEDNETVVVVEAKAETENDNK